MKAFDPRVAPCLGGTFSPRTINSAALQAATLRATRSCSSALAIALGLVNLPERVRPATLMPMTKAISGEQLEQWRAEASRLDAQCERGTERRARNAVMDVSIVLALLDEVERLRAGWRPHHLPN